MLLAGGGGGGVGISADTMKTTARIGLVPILASCEVTPAGPN